MCDTSKNLVRSRFVKNDSSHLTTQQLIEKYIPLANKLAFQKKKNLPRFIDVEELKSAAYLGLVEAASRFDASLGIEFSTFSYPRIFGAICDYLREQGWLKKNGSIQMLSLDMPMKDSEEGYCLRDTIEAKKENSVEECFEALSNKMDDQAKSVMRAYFIDDCSMKEVGNRHKVSESRISQLIKQYKAQIRTEWANDVTGLAA